MKLQWLRSYETIKFDTPDGDINIGQYAKYKNNCYIVRTFQKNNGQFVILDPKEDSEAHNKVKGLTEIHILQNEKMYYDEYLLPNNRILRVPSKQIEYNSLKRNKKPEKDLSKKEIDDIAKEDEKWQ